LRQRLRDGRGKLPVRDQHFGAAVVEHERDRLASRRVFIVFSTAPSIGHAEVAFIHLRRVGRHHRHRVACADAALASAEARRRQRA